MGYKTKIEEYLDGNCSPETEKELYAWLNSDRNNLKEFFRFKEQWKKEHKASSETVSSYKKLCGIIEARESARRRKMTFKWISVAASVAAVVTGVLLSSNASYEKQLMSMTVPQGSITKVELSDGSSVWVNAGSTLTYPQKFRRFKRIVMLNGEGYFEVAHNQRSPFIVKTSSCDFKVLGTKFNIMAYEEDETVTAVLIEGSLKFMSDRFSYTMDPGDMITHNAERTSRERVDPRQYSGWTENKITFDQIALPALLRRVERLYDVRISLDTENFDYRSLRASFSKDDSVDYILKTVCGIFPLRYYVEDGVWHISEKHNEINPQ